MTCHLLTRSLTHSLLAASLLPALHCITSPYAVCPGWGYLVPLAAKRLLQAFTQADAEAKWGVPDAMPAAMVPHWLQLIAAPSSKPPWGRSLRYTAQLVYGCRVGEAEPQEVKDLRARFEGKWGQVFADGRLKDQATSLLGSWQLWEEFHKAVKQAWQKSQQ